LEFMSRFFRRRVALPTLRILILMAMLGSCSPTKERVMTDDRFSQNIVADSRLDSLCRTFVVDDEVRNFRVTDPSVIHAGCYESDLPDLAYLSSDCFRLEVPHPCTVSVVLTDDENRPVAWKHYVLKPTGYASTTCVGKLFPAQNGVYRYSVLINGRLVLSCLAVIIGTLFHNEQGETFSIDKYLTVPTSSVVVAHPRVRFGVSACAPGSQTNRIAQAEIFKPTRGVGHQSTTETPQTSLNINNLPPATLPYGFRIFNRGQIDSGGG